jgi:hypothetical protein
MTTNNNDLDAKLCSEFHCEKCDYNTSKKSSFEKHCESKKHKNNDLTTQNNEIQQILSKKYQCPNCVKFFNDRAGLWRHKKKCICNDDTCETENDNQNQVKCAYDITDKELIVMLVKQNAELIKETSDFKSIMMEVIKNGTHNTSSTINNTNSHNKAFNLNFFLNETCKDAMNINDFVESIKLQVSDLENVGEVGFVEGISNIIVKNLNALDITQRPIHCTDKKRETIYIKDENIWEKDEDQSKMRKAIKKVVTKNIRLIPKFREQYPDYKNSYSKTSDRYNKLIIESMGGSGDNDAEKEDKIIRNIVKNVVVDKSV